MRLKLQENFSARENISATRNKISINRSSASPWHRQSGSNSVFHYFWPGGVQVLAVTKAIVEFYCFGACPVVAEKVSALREHAKHVFIPYIGDIVMASIREEFKNDSQSLKVSARHSL